MDRKVPAIAAPIAERSPRPVAVVLSPFTRLALARKLPAKELAR